MGKKLVAVKYLLVGARSKYLAKHGRYRDKQDLYAVRSDKTLFFEDERTNEEGMNQSSTRHQASLIVD